VSLISAITEPRRHSPTTCTTQELRIGEESPSRWGIDS
jgi:hypothetical protein